MNELSLDSILGIIHSISKEIIQKKFPEEIEFFDIIWNAMKGYISQWKEKLPNELQTYEYQERLKEELGFLDEAEVAQINTPRVIALISLVWLRLVEHKGQVQDVNIEEIIAKYGKSLPEWVRLKTTKLAVPMIKDDLKKIGRISVAETEEEKKYVMYSHDNKDGEPITERDYEKEMIGKKDYFIFLNEKNRDLFINNKSPSRVHPEERRALAFLIKQIGKIAKYGELYLAIHNIREIPEKEWSDRYIEYINDVHKCKSKLIEHCPEIGRFIATKSNDGYKMELPEEIKYCLIEELPEKIT